jgi:hypothetical protein
VPDVYESIRSLPFPALASALGLDLKRFKRRKEDWLRIPAMAITHSDLMAITIPSDADHRRSEATLGCSYHAEVIGMSQDFCC